MSLVLRLVKVFLLLNRVGKRGEIVHLPEAHANGPEVLQRKGAIADLSIHFFFHSVGPVVRLDHRALCGRQQNGDPVMFRQVHRLERTKNTVFEHGFDLLAQHVFLSNAIAYVPLL
jgi:hypothetical protein